MIERNMTSTRAGILAGALSSLLAFVLAVAGPAGASPMGDQKPAQGTAPAEARSMDSAVPEARTADLEEDWGVEIKAIRLTAHGHMLDFRYKVLDAGKAAPLFKRQTKPHLVHVETGKVLEVPAPAKTGPLRTSDLPKKGRTYWMFFGNGGKLIKRGDQVTVVIGGFKAEKLIVE
jgi:hypothetical protein